MLVLHFVAVKSDNLLSVFQLYLNFLRLLHDVVTGRTKGSPRVVIELQEVRGVAEMTRRDCLHEGRKLARLRPIVLSNRWRDVVLPSIVEGKFERGETSDVVLDTNSDLGE